MGTALRRAGHTACDVRDIRLGDAPDSASASYAQAQRLCLLTGDFDFADIRNYPPPLYAGIVVFTLPRHATVAFILQRIRAAGSRIFVRTGRALSNPGARGSSPRGRVFMCLMGKPAL